MLQALQHRIGEMASCLVQGRMHAQTPQPKFAGNDEARTHKGVKVEPALGIKLQGACPVERFSFSPACRTCPHIAHSAQQ